MLALVTAIFTASVLGSLHCAGMCGAFLAIALQSGPGERPTPAWRQQALYHLGRLITYTSLGALAGALGATLNLAGAMAGLQRAAAALAAGTLIIFGAITLLRLWGVAVPRVPLPGPMQRFATAAHRAAMALPPTGRALTIGLLTTLLPCGWLYAFVLVAAGTGHAGWGMLTMAVFWSGTLPALVTLGAGLKAVSGPLARHIPTATACMLVVVGFLTLFGRIGHIGQAPSLRHLTDRGIDAAAVARISDADLPCCQPGDGAGAGAQGKEGGPQ